MRATFVAMVLSSWACDPSKADLSDSDSSAATNDTTEQDTDTDTDSGNQVADTDTPQKDDTGDTAESCEDPCKSPSTASHQSTLADLTYARDRTADNALKGFLTSYLWGEPVSEMPDQLEFLYLPMKDLWDEKGATLETGLEPHFEDAASRGHHVILRVYLDYPARESGMPEYLTESVTCEPYEDYGGGCSPDYTNEELQSAMLGLIEALGDAYDGDTRLGFVQVGLLGYWGEWHTYPNTEWFADETLQDAILEAFETAFSTTELQVRYPTSSSVERRIGFHDDSFAYSTIGDTSWFFWPQIEDAGAEDRWQEVSIGGELRQELQPEVFSDDYTESKYAQDMDECIDQTHVSYLLNYTAYNGDGTGYEGDALERAQEAALRMGYEFHLESATLSATGLLDDAVDATASFDISQTGVAPFYYPLYLQVSSPHLKAPIVSDQDLSALLPEESDTLTIDLGRVPVSLLTDELTVELTASMLQEGQQVLFATESPIPTDAGDLALAWTFGCEADGTSHAVGTVAGTNSEGCDCICDVDGLFRTCDGNTCK